MPVTRALATPHDAVLAELQSPRSAAAQPAAVADSQKMAPKLSLSPSGGSQERSERPASPSLGGARSAASSPGTAQEALYDPFSGALVGVMVPKKSNKDHEHDPLAAQFDQTREEVWSRLASIRELQSAVASMHVQMEGTGTNDHRGTKRAAGVPGRVHSDTIHVDDDWDEPDGAADAGEEQRKRARDAEFNDLSETFRGRRKAIDDIMDKLGELSGALSAFHALPTPTMELNTNSRCNTKDSMPLSPDLTLAASPIASTAVSPSPELPAILPRLVLSEADRNEGVLHESPISGPGEVPAHASPP
ncbi:hypothetical protein BN946_scf185013.g117 [Trametes cinnabarina]|uniref:Uncharacterized protein n=1 Tax=Pycnoporus cinnabarinus TaxID=5643 RepID=A0A060SG35_PYCCI|nr:hypothetical protein BN946_scf185013.g117 [Trametes cinnabarina]